MFQAVIFKNEGVEEDFFRIVEKIGTRRLKERAGISDAPGEDTYIIEFSMEENSEKEKYTLIGESCRAQITANSKSALLTGLGTFMRKSRMWPDKGFIPAEMNEKIELSIPIRGMYLASHNRNYYTEAPIEEVISLIEDLSLWGMNGIKMWYDFKQMSPFDSPRTEVFIERLKYIYSYAKKLGMKTIIGGLANEAPMDSPEELRADWLPQGEYFRELRSHYHVEICPSKPGGIEKIIEYRRRFLERIKDLEIDYFILTPYDQGGCTCDQCAPWGINGFLRCVKAVQPLLKEFFPNAKFILGTHYMNRFILGERELFEKEMEKEWYQENVDYIERSFDPSEVVPDKFIHGSGIAGKPLYSTSDISMVGGKPWGGFGANPLTQKFYQIFQRTKGMYQATFPYSEGIYEDVNKMMSLAEFSGFTKDVFEANYQYASMEFSPDLAADVVHLLNLEEESLLRVRVDDHKPEPGNISIRFAINETQNIDYEYELANKINDALDEYTKNGFRWRLIYLRAVTDYEFFHNNSYVSSRCEECFQELIDMYYGQHAHYCICPPTMESLERNITETIRNSPWHE